MGTALNTCPTFPERPPVHVPTPYSANRLKNTRLAPRRLARELRRFDSCAFASAASPSAASASRCSDRPRSTASSVGVGRSGGRKALRVNGALPTLPPRFPYRSVLHDTRLRVGLRPEPAAPSEWKLSAIAANVLSSSETLLPEGRSTLVRASWCC
jgi:hypothetical protein